MKRSLSIPLKAFSINAMYHKNRSWTTNNYKEWSSSIFHKLDNEESLKALKDIREEFDPAKHGISLDFTFYYPKDIMFTKKGAISARSHDISNIEKPLIDLLFLPKYFGKPSPYGCENLNVDDKVIWDCVSKKRPADEHRIDIIIEIVNVEEYK